MECDMLHAKRVVGRMWLLVVVACGMWREGFVRAERERRGACDGCGGLLEARERESGACCDGGADFCLDT